MVNILYKKETTRNLLKIVFKHVEVSEHQLDDLVRGRDEGVEEADAPRVGQRVIGAAEGSPLFAVSRCKTNAGAACDKNKDSQDIFKTGFRKKTVKCEPNLWTGYSVSIFLLITS